MKFSAPLVSGRLVKRYKRFLADVILDEDGSEITAHCANPGSMLGLKEPGSRVWLSQSDNPKRKLKYSWEIIEADGALVGINTAHPNKLVEEAIEAGNIKDLAGYETLRREVKYGKNSRIDVLLEKTGGERCYVEVKNTTLADGKRGLFPDAVTERGRKHLVELRDMVREGHRAVMFYCVSRSDVTSFAPADDIDPAYGKVLREVVEEGVEILAYSTVVTPDSFELGKRLRLVL